VKSRIAASIIAPVVLVLLPVAGMAANADAEAIIVAGKVVARISSPGQFDSVYQRAAKIDKRITQAISVEDVGDPNMYIAEVAKTPAIFIGKTMLMRVYADDAVRHGISKWQLARIWKGNFAAQFPLAEPVIRMSGEEASRELARAQARTAAAAQVTIPVRDWAIVAVVLDHVSRARLLSEPVFERELPKITQAIYADILQAASNARKDMVSGPPPHAPGECPEPGGCPACRQAKNASIQRDDQHAAAACPPAPRSVQRRIQGGLKLMRSVTEQRYLRDRKMVAYTLVKSVHQTLGRPQRPVRGPRSH